LPNATDKELEGITLSVYLYVVSKGKPVGPRDAMKGAGLSSPSVAYRHLEKLEEMGLLRKNEYGEYVAKSKAKMRGYLWVGRRLVPKMLVYSLVFMGILIAEIAVLFVHLPVENIEFVTFFALLTLITGAAMAVFIVEGFLQLRRGKLHMEAERARQAA